MMARRSNFILLIKFDHLSAVIITNYGADAIAAGHDKNITKEE